MRLSLLFFAAHREGAFLTTNINNNSIKTMKNDLLHTVTTKKLNSSPRFIKNLVLPLFVAFMTVSCVSGNVNTIDKRKLEEIKIGKSTKDDVIRTFGDFRNIQYLDKETTVITYFFTKDKILTYKTSRLDFKISNGIVIEINFSNDVGFL